MMGRKKAEDLSMKSCASSTKDSASGHISAVTLAFAISILGLLVTQGANAQTFTKIHDFTGPDGKLPVGTLTMDAGGNLYGTTTSGGTNEHGTVFKLTRHGLSWIFTTLYRFTGGSDGFAPCGGVAIGPDGALYGTTSDSGCGADPDYCIYNQTCGTVFRLAPPPTFPPSVESPWIKTVLYRFTGGSDGLAPLSKVTFDAAGNLYGTTVMGGISNDTCNQVYGLDGCGTVYKLTHSNGAWIESVIFAFDLGENGVGGAPYSEVTFDTAGNLYGTVYFGANGNGYVYKLMPHGSGWLEYIVDTCLDASSYPTAGVVLDNSGNIFFVPQAAGYVEFYEISLLQRGWQCTDLYDEFWAGPYESLTMDSAGNLYGTDQFGTGQSGDVFEMQFIREGYWEFQLLHLFTGGSDGYLPKSGIVLGPDGTLYGETFQGGLDGWGDVFEITP